jgi:hypothetical protein
MLAILHAGVSVHTGMFVLTCLKKRNQGLSGFLLLIAYLAAAIDTPFHSVVP